MSTSLGTPGPPPHIRRRLTAEGKRVLPQGLPIRLAPLGDVAEIMFRNVCRRVMLHAPTVPDEALNASSAVVLVGYGSSIHHEHWEKLTVFAVPALETYSSRAFTALCNDSWKVYTGFARKSLGVTGTFSGGYPVRGNGRTRWLLRARIHGCWRS